MSRGKFRIIAFERPRPIYPFWPKVQRPTKFQDLVLTKMEPGFTVTEAHKIFESRWEATRHQATKTYDL